MPAITDIEALTRVIEHREIFHDEMLALMRRIMGGEMSQTMMAALLIGLRVKKETIGEIAAAATVTIAVAIAAAEAVAIAAAVAVAAAAAAAAAVAAGRAAAAAAAARQH